MNSQWHRSRLDDWRASVGAYEDTLRRLLRGSFDELTPRERRERADAVVRVCANASTLLAAAPVPFLELPVHAAMVQALGKIYGVPGAGRTALLRVAASLGGGLTLRCLLRFVPLGGTLPLVGRVYAATWALGRAAQLYFERQTDAAWDARRETVDEPPGEMASLPALAADGLGLATRLARLNDLRRHDLLDDSEYRHQRARLLSQL
ncbi:MAG: hypothetical protein HY342_11590 [Candidatus Lambdaproteobacteria bacterium]|nr:hypothetical protein [Candidatus Lambdaproteobacteria bacterium]